MRARGVVGALAAAACLASPAAAAAAPGDLDPSFGVHGVAPQSGPAASAPVVTPDGGAALIIDGESPAIVMVDRSGAPNESFGDGGRAPIEDERFDPSSLARGPGGDLYVAGTIDRFSQESTVAVKRFGPDGAPDLEYGGDGTAEIPYLDSPVDSSGGIAVDGQHVLVGMNLTGDGGDEIALAKLDENGNVDSEFGSGGITEPTPGYRARLAVDGDQYLLGGAGDFTDVNVARFDAGGKHVESFAQKGVLTLPGNYLSDLAIGPGGRLALVYGTALPFPPAKSSDPPLVAFFTREGAPQPGLDPSAALAPDERAGRSFFVGGVAYDDAGRIILSGAWQPESFYASGSDPMLARLEPDGSLDPRFGGGGFSKFPAHGIGVSLLGWVGTDAEGRILTLARSLDHDAAGNSVAALVRFRSSPGKRDADADGILDKRDSCPRVPGQRKRGCPRVPVRVTAEKRGDGLAGTVAGERECFVMRGGDGSTRAARLAIKRVRRGPDERVGKAVIDKKDGSWVFGPRRPGTYYAQFRPAVRPNLGACAGAHSKRVRIR